MISDESIILIFKAFFQYKQLYISQFKTNIDTDVKRDKNYPRKNAMERLKHYIHSFEVNFVYISARDYCPDFCEKWLKDLENQCIKDIDEVYNKYGKKKKQAQV